MNILITGIHGFVGSNLVVAFKEQHTIYGLDIVSPPKDGVLKTFGWNELEKLPEVDVIIHLAGKAHDTKNQSNAQSYFEINTGLTQKIFDWFLSSEARKFIFFSSVKAAADQVEGILTEDVVPAPKGPYGESKIAAEEYILDHLSKHETRNPKPAKKVFILRPCMIHGPGNKGNLNLLYKVVSKGIPWPLGAFENKRSFTSIDNLSFVIGQLVSGNIESGIYHMADDEALSTNELIELISASQGKKSAVWPLPQGFIKGLARLGDILHLPLNSERLKKLTESYVVSNEKIKKALGIQKMPSGAGEGMRKTLASFRKS
ncbi:MAG TPA: NAD-dependent epimerase/dehydratase family protein [Prolixibacteraceae bacterium]|nr:NAD-dependent epimerase/dehydratase family protein [Prolixibacteraceae bacterium]